jgi:arabinofuranan 3-O-arabinosyltransferase
VWHAEVVFAHGGQPYSQAATDHRLYLYPPSSLLVLRPVAMLPLHEAQVLGLAATAAMAWAMVMVTSAALGRRWWGLTSAVAVFALGWAQPMVAELSLENVTVMCALALAVFYLLASRGQFIAAGAVIGLSLSIKPLLLPVVLVFLLARKGRAFCLAVVIPAALNAIAFAVVKSPNQVWSKLPSLLDRSGIGVELNSAWVGVAHGLPGFATILIRLATVALAVAGAWWSWQQITDPATRLITTTSVLLIGTFLAGTLSENHFMLTLVPLAMTMIVPLSPMRRFAAGVGVLLVMGLTPPGSMLGLNSEANLSAFAAFGMALVLLTIVVVLGRRRSAGARTGITMPERNRRRNVLDGTPAR